MANYGVSFNNAGKVVIPDWDGTDYVVQVQFTTPATLATDGLIGNVTVDSYIAVFNTGRVSIKNGTAGASTGDGVLAANTSYTIDLVRVGSDVDFTITDDTGVIFSETFDIGTEIFHIEWIGVTQTLFFSGVIDSVTLNTSGDNRIYASTVNTGSVWTDITNGQDGTLDGLATDGSQWVLATATPPTGNPGTLTTDPLRNNTGTLLASVSGLVMAAYSMTTGELVVRQEALTSDASGVLVMTSATLTPSTEYRVVVTNAAGDGVDRITAV